MKRQRTDGAGLVAFFDIQAGNRSGILLRPHMGPGAHIGCTSLQFNHHHHHYRHLFAQHKALVKTIMLQYEHLS